MENKDSLLIRKYMNLVESIENKLIQNELINEDLIASAAREGKLVASELEGYLKAMNKNKKIADELLKSGIRTSEELLAALKGNRLTSSLKGALELSILKSNTKNAKLIDLASENLVRNKMFDQKYASEFAKGQPAYEKALKDAGYSQDAITKIVQKKFNQIDPKTGKVYERPQTIKQKGISSTHKATETAAADGKISKSFGERIKNLFGKHGNKFKEFMKTKPTWQKLLIWGAGIGVTGAILWYWLSDSGETAEGTPKTAPGEWAECLQKMIDDGSAKIVKFDANSNIVKTNPTTEYPEGLGFFSTGRVVDYKTKKKGSWKCKSGVATITESLNLTESVESDVETMIDLLDFPVTSGDLQDAKNLLQKYSSNPTQGKEFLELYKDSGFGGGSLNKSLDFIYTVNAESVRAKKEMRKLISQIESGKSTTPAPTTGGGATGIGNIEITWDGAKSEGGGGSTGGGGKKKSSFTECDKFPMQMGCKSGKIKEIQVCLGMPANVQTGNFGPATKGYLENYINNKGTKVIDIKDFNATGISEALYDEIKRNCGKTTVVTPPTTSTTTPITSTTTPTTSTTTSTPTTSTAVETPLSNEVVFELSNNLKYQRLLNRYVYKGRDLNPQEEKFIVDYMNKKGYKLGKEKDKKFGEKYVFVKRKK